MEKISKEIREQMINNYVDYAKDKLDEVQLKRAVESLKGSGGSISANLAVASTACFGMSVTAPPKTAPFS